MTSEAKRLHDAVCSCPGDGTDPDCNWRPTIGDVLAIEAEARASQPLTLDVERLARAMHSQFETDPATVEDYIAEAADITRRYANAT